MMGSLVTNGRTGFRVGFAGRRAGSLLEIESTIPSDINAISPLVDRVMSLIEGAHCAGAARTWHPAHEVSDGPGFVRTGGSEVHMHKRSDRNDGNCAR